MGGNALPLALDVRDAEAIEAAVETAGRHFGGIDICINNASAIHLGDTRQVDAKRFDLMHGVNARAAYLVSRACVPWLLQQPEPTHPHVVAAAGLAARVVRSAPALLLE